MDSVLSVVVYTMCFLCCHSEYKYSIYSLMYSIGILSYFIFSLFVQLRFEICA